MKAVELIGEGNDKHQLQAQVPETLPPGRVRIIVPIPEEDEARAAWMPALRGCVSYLTPSATLSPLIPPKIW